MKKSPLTLSTLGILSALGFVESALAQSIALNTQHGIEFSQLQFATPAGSPTVQTSDTGLFGVDLIRLRESTGKTNGYVNVSAGGNWIVRNLKVEEESVFPYSYIGAEFDLGSSIDVDEFEDMEVVYTDLSLDSSSLTLELSSVTALTIQAGEQFIAIGGVPDAPVNSPPSPPDLTDILFGDPTMTDAITQFDHPNIEASTNQCMPASIANSLQYLENTTDLEIPHDNVAGLKGDNSLVGQLDTATNRTVISRFSDSNSGTWGIDGKLTYLAQNGLGGQVQTTHMGEEGTGTDTGDFDVTITVGANSATASGLGTSISFQTLFDAMKEGQDCELVYAWPGGAHAVDAVAAGITKGEPWIVHGSDMDQSTDSEGGGPDGFRFEYLKDTDGDGLLNLNGTNRQLVQVICEKYVPPPPMLTVIGTDDPAGHGPFVTHPPSLLDIILSGSMLTVSGTAPWLPMSGNVQPDNSVELSSTATVAGFSNVMNTFSGNYNSDTNLIEDGQISLGTNGALPTGQPITWNVNLENSSPIPQISPIIRANGFRDSFLVDASDPISLTVEFEAQNMTGTTADWWLVAVSDGVPQSFNLSTGEFENGLFPSFQGGLADVPFTRFKLMDEGLGAGSHTFYFAVDTVPNGIVDESVLSFDFVQVDVR